jgi:3-hydroxyisobutyrate dehydrogenase-like beta-hydroxyacid dehydrogenase
MIMVEKVKCSAATLLLSAATPVPQVAHLRAPVLGVEVGLEFQRAPVVAAGAVQGAARLHPLFEAAAGGAVIRGCFAHVCFTKEL